MVSFSLDIYLRNGQDNLQEDLFLLSCTICLPTEQFHNPVKYIQIYTSPGNRELSLLAMESYPSWQQRAIPHGNRELSLRAIESYLSWQERAISLGRRELPLLTIESYFSWQERTNSSGNRELFVLTIELFVLARESYFS